jgi:hypothetical protein
LEGRSKKIAAHGRVGSNPPLPVADSLDNRARVTESLEQGKSVSLPRIEDLVEIADGVA